MGHPCLKPLEDWKESLDLPLTKGDIQGPDMQVAMRLMKEESKPIFERTTNKKECLTLSKAFTKSSFKTNHFSFLDRLE